MLDDEIKKKAAKKPKIDSKQSPFSSDEGCQLFLSNNFLKMFACILNLLSNILFGISY